MTRRLLPLVACLFAASISAQTYNWIQSPVNGHRYALTAPTSWTAAEAQAQSAGGHLATIRSQAENDWIITTFGGGWIGLSDAAQEGTWVWSSGEQAPYRNWCATQPDNSSGAEHYAVFECNGQGWNDLCPANCRQEPGIIEVSGPVASYTTYRQSCPSSVGLPTLSATDPVIGQPWRLTVDNLRANTSGYLFFALDDQRLGVAQLPLELTSIGAPGCYINVNTLPRSGAIMHPLPSNASGSARVQVGIPSNAAIIGSVFFNQYVSLDAPASRPLRLTTTNAGRGIIGL